MSDERALELWIELPDLLKDDVECDKRYVSGTPFKPMSHGDKIVHVIEHSAYAALAKENEELTDKLYHSTREVETKWYNEITSLRESLNERDKFIEVRGKHVAQLADERDSLRASLIEAVKALELNRTLVTEIQGDDITVTEAEILSVVGRALAKITAKGEL